MRYWIAVASKEHVMRGVRVDLLKSVMAKKVR